MWDVAARVASSATASCSYHPMPAACGSISRSTGSSRCSSRFSRLAPLPRRTADVVIVRALDSSEQASGSDEWEEWSDAPATPKLPRRSSLFMQQPHQPQQQQQLGESMGSFDGDDWSRSELASLSALADSLRSEQSAGGEAEAAAAAAMIQEGQLPRHVCVY